MVETFFKPLQSELVWRTVFMTRHDAEAAIGRDSGSFYNPVRRHSSLNSISPAAYKRQLARAITALHLSEASPQRFGVREDELTLFRYRGFGNPGPTRLETKDGRAFELT
jgi:hypothetical protein